MRSSVHKKTKGFTLIEMLVAVFVFSIIMTIAVGAIFSIISAYKTSQALKSAMDNLSSALDSMSRDVRYGSVYHCGSSGDTSVPQSCLEGSGDDSTFSFVDKDDNQVTYNFLADQNATDHSGSIYSCTLPHGVLTGQCVPVRLTAPEVHITNLHFYVKSAQYDDVSDPTQAGQPMLLITISGYAQAGAKPSVFNIETMVDQRNLTCKQSVQNVIDPTNPCP